MMEEVRVLIQKAQRSLALAQKIFDGEDYDFAASRAYYAMFYWAEAALLTRGLAFSRHRGVIDGFFHTFVEPGLLPQELHKTLRQSFEERNIGDYGKEPFSRERAERILARAQEFCAKVEAFLQQEDL